LRSYRFEFVCTIYFDNVRLYFCSDFSFIKFQMIPCSWKESFGIECFMCGFQRSLISLFKGDLLLSLVYFPATIPLLLTFAITCLHLYFKWNFGPKLIISLFSFSAILILINYGMKISAKF